MAVRQFDRERLPDRRRRRGNAPPRERHRTQCRHRDHRGGGSRPRNAEHEAALYALDDYGSGYSNEGNLITLDPDFIKIDISIIRGIESDPDKQEVVRNIVSYAHQRGMQIVAEGIETAAELRTSRALGADLFQGYFLSRPGAVPSAIAAPAQEILREFPNGAEEHR